MRAGSRRLAAALLLVAGVAGGASIPAAHGEDPAGRADELRRENAALESRARSAELELFALESRLDRVRADVARLERRASVLRAEQDAAREQAAAARRTLAGAQRFLAERLRALYEEGRTDPLEILLGAESLDAALAGIDGLTFAAQQDREIMAQARLAERRLAKLSRRLAAREASLAALREQAAARAGSLARAKAAREGFLVELAAERGANARRIVSLERASAAARARAQLLATAAPAAPAAAPVPAPAARAPEDPEPAAAPEPEGTLTVVATGYSLPGRTASGLPVGWGVAAVDPGVIPLGTRFTVPGYGEAVAADVGSAVRGAKIDLWFPTRGEALAWGVRTVRITLDG